VRIRNVVSLGQIQVQIGDEQAGALLARRREGRGELCVGRHSADIADVAIVGVWVCGCVGVTLADLAAHLEI